MISSIVHSRFEVCDDKRTEQKQASVVMTNMNFPCPSRHLTIGTLRITYSNDPNHRGQGLNHMMVVLDVDESTCE
jgi:hypothetical protein